MKKRFKIVLMLFIILVGINMNFSTNEADAYYNTIPVQIVEDLENYPYPEATYISNNYYDQMNYGEFTIASQGQLKTIFRCQENSKLSGSAWISTDRNGKNIIGNVFKFSSTETEGSWFLEEGTYYLCSLWGETISVINVALLFENSKAMDGTIGYSFADSKIMDLNNTYKGFLLNTRPNEYYRFELNQKAAITLKYTFDTSVSSDEDLGYCSLYDQDEFYLKEDIYSKGDNGIRTFTYLLEKGIYYIKMNGILGNTTISASPMYYDIQLTTASNDLWTDETIDINIDTIIDYSGIIVLCKDVKDSLLNNNTVWSALSEDYVVLDGETFTATKSGIYSVRITDIYGNHTMKKIKISNIDIKRPTIKGVTNGKAYRDPIKITWLDTQSGINKNKTTLNGKKVTSGIVIKKEGKYTLYVYDMIGNYRKIIFYVDYTAPTAKVTNGKIYTDTVTLKVIDNLSGIKYITLDGIEQSKEFTTLYCYQNGEYILKLWDYAGNYRKIVFYIK